MLLEDRCANVLFVIDSNVKSCACLSSKELNQMLKLDIVSVDAAQKERGDS